MGGGLVGHIAELWSRCLPRISTPAPQAALGPSWKASPCTPGCTLHANDREALERLCAYGARPPLSLERLAPLPDGRLAYRLKRPLRDGFGR